MFKDNCIILQHVTYKSLSLSTVIVEYCCRTPHRGGKPVYMDLLKEIDAESQRGMLVIHLPSQLEGNTHILKKGKVVCG